MTKPDLSTVNAGTYLSQWDEVARGALQSLLTFHGACDQGAPTLAAKAAARAADALMAERMARETEIKEAKEAAAEAKKSQK